MTPAAAARARPSQSAPASEGASEAPARARRPAAAPAFDPACVTGDLTLQGWSAGAVEAPILDKVLDDFKAKYPNIKVEFEPIAGDYPAAMAAKFSSGELPDLFYVDSSVAPDWIDQGVLQELDTRWPQSRLRHEPVLPGLSRRVQGPRRQDLRLPEGRQHARDGLQHRHARPRPASTPPTDWDELKAAADEAQDPGDQKAFCLSATASTGRSRSSTRTAARSSATTRPDTRRLARDHRRRIKTYLGFFKSGQGARAGDLGDDWCGKALGEKQVAIIFEGGWLDPYMKENYPDVKYAWAEMPMGTREGDARLHRELLDRCRLARTRTRPGCCSTYLTGPEGMKTWTEGGVANPSRKDVCRRTRQGDPRQGRGVRPAVELHPGLQQDQRRVQQRDDRGRSKGDDSAPGSWRRRRRRIDDASSS